MPDSNDQQAQPNPYAAQPLTGPFVGAITPQIVTPPHESTGSFHTSPSKGGAVAGILDKFLAGYGKGQMQKQMATEMQKYEYNRGFANWRDSVLKDSSVPTTTLDGAPLKAVFERETLQAQLKTAAQATAEHKENPVLGALHKVFSGLSGGEVTKSKSDLPAMQDVQSKWASKLDNPEYTVPGQQQIILGRTQQAIATEAAKAKQGGREFSREDAAKVIQPALGKFEELWGTHAKTVIDQILSPFDKAKAPPAPGSPEAKRAEATKAYADAAAKSTTPPDARPPGGTPPPAQASATAPPAPAATAPPPAARGQSPSSDKPSTPPASKPTVILPEALPVLRDEELIGKPEERVVAGETKPRLLYPIQPITPPGAPAIPGGMLDMETREVFKSSDTSKYKEPTKLSPKEQQDNVDAEQGWGDLHGVKPADMTQSQRTQAHEWAKNKSTGELKNLEIAYGVIKNKKGESPERVQAAQAYIRDHEMKNLAEVTKLNEQKNTQPWDIKSPQPGKAPIDRFDGKQKQIIAKSLNYLTGAVPTLGISGTLRDQVLSGIGAIEEVTGVSPEELNSRVTARKAEASALPRLTLLNDSVEGLENALDKHGKILEELRPKLPSTDVKVLNQWLLTKDLEFDTGTVSKDAVRYALALQAVKSEYARVIASGAASAGQTNVNAAQEAGELISKGFSTGQTKAMIDQIRTETRQRTAGYREELKDIQNRLAVGIIPELYGKKYIGPHEGPPETRQSTVDKLLDKYK
jgi:hypothetical protein